MQRTKAIGFTIKEVSADKAYPSFHNYEEVERAGGTPYLIFKTTHVGANGPPIWQRMYAYFMLHRDEYLSRYHLRSNVEALFSSIKRKYGVIRSKTDVAQTNEILAKFIAHNLSMLVHAIEELKIDPQFWRPNADPSAHGDAA